MPRIEQWGIVARPSDNPYLAPELRFNALHGKVYGHPDLEDGSNALTSTITELSHTQAKTRSGTVYELGEMAPAFKEYMAGLGVTLDNYIEGIKRRNAR